MGERVSEKNVPPSWFTVYMCQDLLKRPMGMAGNDDQSALAVGKGCSLNRSGRQRCILGCWLMVTHDPPAAEVAHGITTVVSSDEEVAGSAGHLIDARLNVAVINTALYTGGRFAPLHDFICSLFAPCRSSFTRTFII
jgi:hypothetical protein